MLEKSSKIVPSGAPLFSCSINHLAHHCGFDCLTIFADIMDNWLRNECRNLESSPTFAGKVCRQMSSSRICSAYCAVTSLFSWPSQNFRLSSWTPDLASIEDRKRRNQRVYATAHSYLFLLVIYSAWKFPSLPFPTSFFELPRKRILRKPANFLPESNQRFVGHPAQFIPQFP